MEYVNESPNFSIILPGGCNARCKFCFWRRQTGDFATDFAAGLARALRVLPANFRACSLTGGEPTISPALSATLATLRLSGRKWDRIVLTTNGRALLPWVEQIASVCTHVNVSRHGISDRVNRHVFGTNLVPSRNELRSAVAALGSRGVPVTLSRVLDAYHPETRESIERYLAFAKRIGVASVHLRKPCGDLSPHPVEAEFAHIRAWDASCPACSTRLQFISGMPVTWKRGLVETADVGRHEAILQSDGRLTWDWAGRVPFTRPRPPRPIGVISPDVTGAGCGREFRGGC